MKIKGAALVWICALALVPTAFAGESQFGFVNTTDLLPKDEQEIEQWITYKTQKKQGTFNMVEGRTAYEFGVTDNFQLSFYAKYAWTEAYHNGLDGETSPPEQFAADSPDPDERYNRTQFIGFSVEGIYRILSPYTDRIGLAIYMEPTWGPDFFEMDTKLILQKNFLDDTVTVAFNLTHAPEFRYLRQDDGSKVWQQETDLNLYLGASYRFAANWSLGAELLNEQEYNDYLDFNHIANNGYFFGPSLHFSSKTFFVTAVLLAQMPWAGSYADTIPGALKDGYLYDQDFERYRARVKMGWVF